MTGFSFITVYFNPRPPRGGRPKRLSARSCQKGISIHAPREGGDDVIRAYPGLYEVFQSTPPARGGDGIDGAAVQVDQISIHAPREGGDHIISSYPVKTFISIHAPREGGDQT